MKVLVLIDVLSNSKFLSFYIEPDRVFRMENSGNEYFYPLREKRETVKY